MGVYLRVALLKMEEELVRDVREELAVQRLSNYVPDETPAWVVVLSAPPTITLQGTIEDNVENTARVLYGVALVEEITAKRLLVPVEMLNADHLFQAKVMLTLNGETEQLYALRCIAYKEGSFPKELVELINSGDRDESNTMTQFQAMDRDLRYLGCPMVVVTSGYHVPRVRRTARLWLRNPRLVIAGVPYSRYPYGTEEEEKEVEKILRYAKRGDIADDSL